MSRLQTLLLNRLSGAAVDLMAFAAVIVVAIYLTEGAWRIGTALASGTFFAAFCAVIDRASGRR